MPTKSTNQNIVRVKGSTQNFAKRIFNCLARKPFILEQTARLQIGLGWQGLGLSRSGSRGRVGGQET